MTTIAVCTSTPGYNLALAKLSHWAKKQGWRVEQLKDIRPFDGFQYDIVAISVVFSWDLPLAFEWGRQIKTELWMGGPAVSANVSLVRKQLPQALITSGPDSRFEREIGDYEWSRWGRGCSVGCWFCIVPKIDGDQFIEYPETSASRVIIDDNIIRYSREHQERIVEKNLEAGTQKIDLMSGFDPAVFEQWHFDLYSKLDLLYWRTAYDTVDEAPQVERLLRLLKEQGISRNRIPVYMLGGAEPFETSMERAQQIITWGGEPRIQMYKPLNYLKPRHEPWIHPKFDWTYEQAVNFPRYWYSYRWRSESWQTWFNRQGLRAPLSVSAPGVVQQLPLIEVTP